MKPIGIAIPSLFSDHRYAALKRCLDSLRRQTVPTIVSLCLDGYDLTKTVHLMSQYHCRIIQGLGVQNISMVRNRALSNIFPREVDYVVHADDDVVFKPDTLPFLSDVLERFIKVGIVTTLPPNSYMHLQRRQFKDAYIKRTSIVGICWMTRMKLHTVNNDSCLPMLFDERIDMIEDREFALRVFKAGYEVVMCRDAEIEHKRHTGSGCGPVKERGYDKALKYIVRKHPEAKRRWNKNAKMFSGPDMLSGLRKAGIISPSYVRERDETN